MKDWLNDIQEKLGDYGIVPPEDLRRKMEANGILSSKRSSGRHIIPAWARYVAPCAASAVLAFILFTKENDIRPDADPITPSFRIAPDTLGRELLTQTTLPAPKAIYLKERVAAEAIMGIQATDICDFPANDTICLPEQASMPPEVENDIVVDNTDFSAVDQFAFDDEGKRPLKKSPVILAFLGALGAQSSYAPQIVSMAEQYASTTGAELDGLPVMARMLCAAPFEGEEETVEEEIAESYSHRLPLKFGISAEYRLDDRWSVSCGLNYSFLASDIYDSSGAEIFGVQKLSYLGVPLNIKLNALTAGMFNAYLTAGGSAEYCITGQREIFCDVSGVISNSIDRYTEHPFQFSVNASAGAEYSIISHMSLFAEVGASYYFNDGSGIQTIYKERPLSFNTNVGIRFKFGK